ncbi:MAG: hypothetical protein U5R49_25290 [Deltaproteobacteria bacterium]|nr:hypothetical protein [Deltaproteobacteria bacterium]
MTKISSEFVRAYGLLEQDYADCRHDISCISMEGPEKEIALNQLISKYEPIRRDGMQRLGEITTHFTELERETHQQWVQQTDHWRNIHEAPFCWRIINKPEGYPGDYRLMEMIYEQRQEGETDWGKFIHKQAVDSVACQAVRNRKDFLREQIFSMNCGGG